MDGVNSMTGNAPDLHEFARVAREHEALLYVDDAHGFGVIGERAVDEPCSYGLREAGVHLSNRHAANLRQQGDAKPGAEGRRGAQRDAGIVVEIVYAAHDELHDIAR